MDKINQLLKIIRLWKLILNVNQLTRLKPLKITTNKQFIVVLLGALRRRATHLQLDKTIKHGI